MSKHRANFEFGDTADRSFPGNKNINVARIDFGKESRCLEETGVNWKVRRTRRERVGKPFNRIKSWLSY